MDEKELLGMRLEEALARLAREGVAARVEETASPRGAKASGEMRVVRVAGDLMTVARFPESAKADNA